MHNKATMLNNKHSNHRGCLWQARPGQERHALLVLLVLTLSDRGQPHPTCREWSSLCLTVGSLTQHVMGSLTQHDQVRPPSTHADSTSCILTHQLHAQGAAPSCTLSLSAAFDAVRHTAPRSV